MVSRSLGFMVVAFLVMRKVFFIYVLLVFVASTVVSARLFVMLFVVIMGILGKVLRVWYRRGRRLCVLVWLLVLLFCTHRM